MLMVVAIAGIAIFLLPATLSVSTRYRYRWLAGIGLGLLFFVLGAVLLFNRQPENETDWLGKHYLPGDQLIVSLDEPLIEKPNSFKAVAKVRQLVRKGITLPVTGNVIIYFSKETRVDSLHYGTRIILSNHLQRIRNSGNPGAFDYARYCAMNDIHYQVYLRQEEVVTLTGSDVNVVREAIYKARTWLLGVLRNNIDGKSEIGIAEALLIGYRGDLDRSLLQSYSNTGVVHVIAISGLHLGMIYGLVAWLLRAIGRRRTKIFRMIILLLVLWGFSFLAGAGPSIVRSAIMFSCLVVADAFGRRSDGLNALAVSFFLLVATNPFNLWDVGFQLSYTAVAGILLFMRPITRQLFFRNPIMLRIWQLTAMTISAQVLTLPVMLYHFHQFPNLFLFTNLVVVPLSGLILFAELLLVVVSFVPFLAKAVGWVAEMLISWMNVFVQRTEQLPFASTKGIIIHLPEVVFLFAMIVCIAYWFHHRRASLLLISLCCLAAILAIRAATIISMSDQRKLIVYNIARHSVIDLVDQFHFQTRASRSAEADPNIVGFHLQPARTQLRVSPGETASIGMEGNLVYTANKKVLLLDASQAQPLPSLSRVDAVIISGNPRLYIADLSRHMHVDLLVFDASNPAWKIRLWKKECDSLHLRHYSVPDQGAFIMDL